MSKIHYRDNKGNVFCKCNNRWHSTLLTSTKSFAKVTCKNCIKIIRNATSNA